MPCISLVILNFIDLIHIISVCVIDLIHIISVCVIDLIHIISVCVIDLIHIISFQCVWSHCTSRRRSQSQLRNDKNIMSLHKCLENSNILIYAEDAVIYTSHKEKRTLELMLTQDMNNIANWLGKNKLIINLKRAI